MSSRNTIIVVSIIFGSLLTLGLVLVIRDAGLKSEPFVDKGQRFTAKPGTTRENAMILTSNKRADTQAPKDAIARRSDQKEESSDPLEIKSLSKSETDSMRSGPAGDAARAALNNYSPEAGLRQLDAALALPSTPAQTALLHEAAGQLHAQTSPPNYDKSLESFQTAAALAEDSGIQEEIVYKTAQMLMQADRDGEARQAVNEFLDENPPVSATGYKLKIIQGQLLERAGRAEDAESAYQYVLNAARTLPEELDKDAALSLARLAGLRLTNLYRKHDRNQAADTLAKDLKRELTNLQDR